MKREAKRITDLIYKNSGFVTMPGCYNVEENEFYHLCCCSIDSGKDLFKIHAELTHAEWDSAHIFGKHEKFLGYLRTAKEWPMCFKSINADRVYQNIDISANEYFWFNSKEYRRIQACEYTSNKLIRKTIFARDGKICSHCGATTKLCLDHIVPVSKGGVDTLENLQVLCKTCNSKKGAS